MPDASRIGTIVKNHIAPLIRRSRDPKLGKSVGILVGVTYDGGRYYFDFGHVGLHDGGSVPIQDIVFFIGSNTKVFTATLLALAALSASNSVTPSTSVASLLPSGVGINQPHGEILLPHLATHSAGFPDGPCGPQLAFGDYPFMSMGEFLSDFKPHYAPGKRWVYSNQGFALLGVLLSHARKVGLFVFGNTSGGAAGDALTQTGRRLLGALRDSPADRSVYPSPTSVPACP